MWIPIDREPFQGKPWYVQLGLAVSTIALMAAGYLVCSLLFTLVKYWRGTADLTPIQDPSLMDSVHDAVLSWLGLLQ